MAECGGRSRKSCSGSTSAIRTAVKPQPRTTRTAVKPQRGVTPTYKTPAAPIGPPSSHANPR
ncbi:hypothetical protein F4803DRAFT_558120 [Xylaria telfairii]|nr:hypothetical protein F4803DRAFT_558120 [Xylaria telfairii]